MIDDAFEWNMGTNGYRMTSRVVIRLKLMYLVIELRINVATINFLISGRNENRIDIN